MTFLEDALSGKTAEGLVEEIAVEETPIAEVVVETEIEEVVATEPIVEEPKPLEKKKIDYNKFLEENDEVFSNYYKEKGTNYKEMSPDKLAELQVRKQYPELSEKDIQFELAEKYGIGATVYSEDADDYDDPDELKEAKKANKETAKLQRQLTKDAPLFAKEFEDSKQGITLPEFELDFEVPQAGEQLSDEDYIKKFEEQGETYKNDVWIPELKKTLESFESIKEQVEYEDNGNKVVLDVDYKLSTTDKEELLSELQDYIVTGKDRERYQDLDGFLKDKAPAKYYQKLMTTVAKEAAAKARASFVKNDLLNYDDSPRSRSTGEDNGDFATAFFAANRKNKL